MAKVSIIIPVYNGADLITKAIDSVLKQSFADWEMLVIDDGSTDNTGTIILHYAESDNRIRYFTHPENQGLVASLNHGLRQAAGEFIARLDADDFWNDASKLQKQLDFLLEHQEVGLVGTWGKVINFDGEHLYDLKYPALDQEIRNNILSFNCFIHSSVMFRKSLVEMYSSQSQVEDYHLWLEMGKKTKFANLPEFLVTFRSNPGGYTQTRGKLQIQACMDLIKLYRDVYPNYFRGWMKWWVQLKLMKILGASFLTKLKSWLKEKN